MSMTVGEFKKLEKVNIKWDEVQHRTGGMGLRRKVKMTIPRMNSLIWKYELMRRDFMDKEIWRELDKRNKGLLKHMSRKFKYIYEGVKEEVVKDEKGHIIGHKVSGKRVKIVQMLRYC